MYLGVALNLHMAGTPGTAAAEAPAPDAGGSLIKYFAMTCLALLYLWMA